MSSLRLATASNVRAFQNLSNALGTTDSKWSISLDREAFEDEAGRFRVWSGNLGALQKGHSSLDYRLRDSPLLSTNALKFLKELEENINEAVAIVSGDRLPYEEQPRPEKTEDEEEDDDFFSEDEDDDKASLAGSSTELSMRFAEIVDIIDNLYKLSVRIRTPTIRSRSLKAASFKPRDPETGVDILSLYANYDLQHIKELLSQLRQQRLDGNSKEEDFLGARLSAAVTLRRRQFKYWKRHRDKLGASTILEETSYIPASDMRPNPPLRYDTLEVHPASPPITALKGAPSQKTAKTMLSGTEATHHHQSLDDIVDSKSVTSYAVTVKDIQGRGVDLPPPPKKAANGDKDFECPYCYIICPARYGGGRAWRTHLLQDLQPYICTYPECDSSEQLFRSRREWAEHEATHRKVWRCPEHPTAVYKSHAGLEDHLRRKHLDSFPESQLTTIVKVGETSTVDLRGKCPICYASSDMDGLGDFQNHIANHLERIATFALPNDMEEEGEGASSVASRGWSGSTGSQDISEMSLPSDDSLERGEREEDAPTSRHAQSPNTTLVDPNRALLSLESLRLLPDASQNRVDMIANQLDGSGTFEGSPPGDTQSDDPPDSEDEADDFPADIKDHLEEREAFRAYLLASPGAESVRFYRRYGSWNGQAVFSDEATAAKAVELFDFERFCYVKIRQVLDARQKLKFSTTDLAKGMRLPPSRKSTGSQDEEDTKSVPSSSISYDGEAETSSKQPILTIAEIPTLRSLYRSRRLLQRDQSYAPKDGYNRTISFCYHDLTRLKVDAIINSANRFLKMTRNGETLNHAIHKGGGPDFTKEAKSKGTIKTGQVELTHGHDLPSAWVIHAARPQYSGSQGMGKFNILTECYRSALKMASNYEFKTIAFPCLGAGGCGFPSRVAARLALQEVREYLDAHENHPFERVIFCVNSAVDEKAYMDFLPVFFPPTHGDLDRANMSEFSANRAALAVQVLETRALIQKLHQELSTDFSLTVPDFDENILKELSAIDSALSSIRGFLLGPKELRRSLGDLNLICSVLQSVCGSVTDATELARDTTSSGRTHRSIWTDYNDTMKTIHSTDLSNFLLDCQNFVQSLNDILTHEKVEEDNISLIRIRMESYGTKQKGQDSEGIRDHLDEALYIREFQRSAAPRNRGIVRLHQISSVSKMYQLGLLEAKPTLAQPSEMFNHVVCLAREDITKLEVDIMVNSTDIQFMGMGTLDRSVFTQGGVELRNEVQQFGRCSEGDVKLTRGYLLPAKHILHVVPPEQYRKNTKDILRSIYREILHTAMLMRATSVAIPSIGTGMLNYPRRDCASLAMEEAKRFLESAEPTSLIEKIIFVVYSSNDEFIYKSLLPVYYPPKNYADQIPPAAQAVELEGEPLSRQSSAPRRTLFGSIGDALRGVRRGKQPESSRLISPYEEHALIAFETHVKKCVTCKDIKRLYIEGRDLCEEGYTLAQRLLWYMNMTEDQTVHTRPDENGRQFTVEIPEIFPLSLNLLRTVEKSFRDPSRSRPFVSSNHQLPATATQEQEKPPSVILHGTKISSLAQSKTSLGQYSAEVCTWSIDFYRWDPMLDRDCSVHIYPGKVEIWESDDPNRSPFPLLALRVLPTTSVARFASSTELIMSGAQPLDTTVESVDILFRSQGAAQSAALLRVLQRAIGRTSEGANDELPIKRERTTSLGETAGPSKAESLSRKDIEITKSDLGQDSSPPNVTFEPASIKRSEGRLSSLRFKMQSLSEAASKLGSASLRPSLSSSRRSSEKREELLNLPSVPTHEPTATRPESRTTHTGDASPLAAQILAHLINDLKSRPGSYIGQHTNDIATALRRSPTEVSTAIEELSAVKKVHNTVDGSTWVVSQPPRELPVLSQSRTEPDEEAIYASMNITVAQVLSYMEDLQHMPQRESGRSIRDIAAALQLPKADIWSAIRELVTVKKIERAPGGGESWMLVRTPTSTLEEVFPETVKGSTDQPHTSTATAAVRDSTHFHDTPPSPTSPSSSKQPPTTSPTPILPFDRLDIDNFISYPTPSGARWTRINKQIVDAQVLIEANEEFDEEAESLVIHRVLRRGEVQDWMEKTAFLWEKRKEIVRKRNDEVESAALLEGSDVESEGREREHVPGESPPAPAGTKAKGKEPAAENDRSKTRPTLSNPAFLTSEAGLRFSRRRDEDAGERDRRQEKLDRVLAGDMEEAELRYFAEGDRKRGGGREREDRSRER